MRLSWMPEIERRKEADKNGDIRLFEKDRTKR